MTSSRERAAGATLLALAMLFILLSLLPWASWLGVASETESDALRAIARGWIVWLALVFAATALLYYRFGPRLDSYLESWRLRLDGIPFATYATVATLLALLAGLILSNVLFERQPHLVDTIAQLFHARIFAGGALSAPAPSHPEFFTGSHLIVHAGRWLSQYPPGHSALLSLGLLVNAAWVINPLFSAATTLVLVLTARRTLSDGAARIAAVLYLISPFMLFMSASFMNHVTVAFFLSLGLYATVRALEPGASWRWSAVMGLAMAAAAHSRPLEAASWAATLGLWMVVHGRRREAVIAAVVCALGLVPLFAYNAATSASPLRFGYTLLWGEGHGLGFHTDPWGEPFTPVVSFANTALDLQRLNDQLFGLPFPSLIFVVAALLLAARNRIERKATTLLVLLTIAAPAAYFFYWHRDNYLGPRFLHASLVPLLLLSATGVAGLDEWLGRRRLFLRVPLALGVLFALTFQLPDRAGIIAGQEPELKLDPQAQVAGQGIVRALLLVKVGWGSRLIGRLWGWGVPASETERSYRVVDGCRLQLALDEADLLAATGVDSAAVLSQLRHRLAAWREADLPVVDDLLADHSVRLDTVAQLSELCRREIARDSSGFTLYESLIWRQDPWLARAIVYARDLGPELNTRLLEPYGDRDWYMYAPQSRRRGEVPSLFRYDTSSEVTRNP